jgi:hypothetical protein
MKSVVKSESVILEGKGSEGKECGKGKTVVGIWEECSFNFFRIWAS